MSGSTAWPRGEDEKDKSTQNGKKGRKESTTWQIDPQNVFDFMTLRRFPLRRIGKCRLCVLGLGEGQGRRRAVWPPINPLIEGEGVGGTPTKWEGGSEREGGLQGEKGGSSGGLFKIFMFYFALFSLVAGNWRASYWMWSGVKGEKDMVLGCSGDGGRRRLRGWWRQC